MTGPKPSPLPLTTSTTCPRCGHIVAVSLTAIGAEAQPRTLELTPSYTAFHRCPDLESHEDPWAVPGAPS
jgi:hypothetical protein